MNFVQRTKLHNLVALHPIQRLFSAKNVFIRTNPRKFFLTPVLDEQFLYAAVNLVQNTYKTHPTRAMLFWVAFLPFVAFLPEAFLPFARSPARPPANIVAWAANRDGRVLERDLAAQGPRTFLHAGGNGRVLERERAAQRPRTFVQLAGRIAPHANHTAVDYGPRAICS